jgi:hypothetical protein
MAERPVDTRRLRLEHMQPAEAAARDPAQPFSIREQIKEAETRIADLEWDGSIQFPRQPGPSQPTPVQLLR